MSGLAALVLSAGVAAPGPARAGGVEAAHDFYGKGRRLLQAGDEPGARAAFQQALREAPGWLLPQLELGELAVRRKEEVPAQRAALSPLVREAPENPRLFRVLGELAELEGDDRSSVEAFTRSLALNPDQPLLRPRRAAALSRLGRHGEAADELGAVLAGSPDDLALRAVRADALEQAGRVDEARRELEELIRRQAGRESPLRRLARFLDRHGDPSAAAAVHAKADRAAKAPKKERDLRPLKPSRW